MHFSKTVFVLLAGTTAASSYILELNSTELGTVLAGAGPVITEPITVPEHPTLLPKGTPRYKWLNLPIRLTRIPNLSSMYGEQTEPSGPPRHLLHGPQIISPLSATVTSPNTNPGRVLRIKIYGSTIQGSNTAASKTTISQPVATTEFLQTTQGMETRLVKKQLKWMSDLDMTVSIQTTYPTWSVSYRKFHGPQFRPKVTPVASTTVEEESTMEVTVETVPVITASAFTV